jgi:hypothetical protein
LAGNGERIECRQVGAAGDALKHAGNDFADHERM